MLLDLLEIVVAAFQYLYLVMTAPEVPYPRSWTNTGVAFSVLTLGKDLLAEHVDFFLNANFKVFFTLISVLLPLLLIFIGLIALNTKRIVIWFFVLLVSLLLLGAGVASRVIASFFGSTIKEDAAVNMIIIGACLFLVCMVTFFIQKFTDCCSEKQVSTDEQLSLQEVMILETKDFSFTEQMEGGAIFVLTFVVGLILVGAITAGSLGLEAIGLGSSAVLRILLPIGVVLLILAGLAAPWIVLSWFKRGREIRWRMSNFVQSHAMWGLLILMSLLYIPITSSTMLMFNCNEVGCPAGQRLLDEGSSLQPYNAGEREACMGCIVAPASLAVCPSYVATSACGGYTDQRLEAALDTPCSRLQGYFWPAAAINIIVFIIGLPVLFYRIIQQSSDGVFEEVPKDPIAEEEGEVWASKVRNTDNVAKFLYQPMEFRYRYWRLFEIVRRMIVTIVAVYIFRPGFSSGYIALYVSAATHLVLTAVSLFTAPFIDSYEDKANWICALTLVGFLAFAILTLHGAGIPDALMTLVLAVSISIPGLVLVIGLWRWYTLRKRETADQRVRDQAELARLFEEVVEHTERVRTEEAEAFAEEERQFRDRQERRRNKKIYRRKASLNRNDRSSGGGGGEAMEPLSESQRLEMSAQENGGDYLLQARAVNSETDYSYNDQLSSPSAADSPRANGGGDSCPSASPVDYQGLGGSTQYASGHGNDQQDDDDDAMEETEGSEGESPMHIGKNINPQQFSRTFEPPAARAKAARAGTAEGAMGASSNRNPFQPPSNGLDGTLTGASEGEGASESHGGVNSDGGATPPPLGGLAAAYPDDMPNTAKPTDYAAEGRKRRKKVTTTQRLLEMCLKKTPNHRAPDHMVRNPLTAPRGASLLDVSGGFGDSGGHGHDHESNEHSMTMADSTGADGGRVKPRETQPTLGLLPVLAGRKNKGKKKKDGKTEDPEDTMTERQRRLLKKRRELVREAKKEEKLRRVNERRNSNSVANTFEAALAGSHSKLGPQQSMSFSSQGKSLGLSPTSASVATGFGGSSLPVTKPAAPAIAAVPPPPSALVGHNPFASGSGGGAGRAASGRTQGRLSLFNAFGDDAGGDAFDKTANYGPRRASVSVPAILASPATTKFVQDRRQSKRRSDVNDILGLKESLAQTSTAGILMGNDAAEDTPKAGKVRRKNKKGGATATGNGKMARLGEPETVTSALTHIKTAAGADKTNRNSVVLSMRVADQEYHSVPVDPEKLARVVDARHRHSATAGMGLGTDTLINATWGSMGAALGETHSSTVFDQTSGTFSRTQQRTRDRRGDVIIPDNEEDQCFFIIDGSVAVEEVAEHRFILNKRRQVAETHSADLRINRTVQRTFNLWLMAAGILTFLALGFCFLGLVAQQERTLLPSQHSLYASNGADTTITTELAGYSSWDNFTRSCCCIPFAIPITNREANATLLQELLQRASLNNASLAATGLSIANSNSKKFFLPSAGNDNNGDLFVNDVAKAEKWVCANGIIKERVRSIRTGLSQLREDNRLSFGAEVQSYVLTLAATTTTMGTTTTTAATTTTATGTTTTPANTTTARPSTTTAATTATTVIREIDSTLTVRGLCSPVFMRPSQCRVVVRLQGLLTVAELDCPDSSIPAAHKLLW